MKTTKKRRVRALRLACLAALWMTRVSSEALGSEPSSVTPEPAQWEYEAIKSLRTRNPRDDVSSQLEQLHKAAAAGRPVAQFMLGRYYLEGTWVTKDRSRGVQLIEAAAHRGLALAQGNLGWIYASGINGAPNRAEAERWFILAAKQGDGYAAGMLSQFYWNQAPTGKPPDLAKQLLRRSAELADNDSRFLLASALLEGPDEERDPHLGEYLLLQAAQARDPLAATLLGYEYLSGATLKKDAAQGAHWISEASKQEYTLARLWLSNLAAKGLGIPKDAEYSEHLLRTALRSANASDKNLFAWQLAVDANEELRNPELALRILEPALAQTDAPNAAHVDTLAAAYASAGRFDEAVQAQERAIKLAQQQKPGSMAQMQERLALYRKGIPFYESEL